jgi:hypothetical protein
MNRVGQEFLARYSYWTLTLDILCLPIFMDIGGHEAVCDHATFRSQNSKIARAYPNSLEMLVFGLLNLSPIITDRLSQSLCQKFGYRQSNFY